MNWFERFVTEHMRARGWHTYWIITPSLDDLSRLRAVLGGNGYRVFNPGEALPEKPVTLDQAKAVFQAHGYKAFPPREMPKLGPWVPTVKGKEAHIRTVTATADQEVHYTAHGETHSVSVGGFWAWRSKVNAVHKDIPSL